MGTQTAVYLPDGQHVWLPPAPSTWTDAGTAVQGSPLRAPKLEISAGMAVAWHRQRPLFQGIATLSQSIASSTWTAITGLSELIDNWSGHSDSSNTGRYYAPYTQTSGSDWYLCTGLVPFNSTSASAGHIAGLRTNGTGTVLEGAKLPSGTGHGVTCFVCDLVQMSGVNNDYVELMAYQTTGASVGTVVTGKSPVLTVRWACIDTTWSNGATPGLPAVRRTWLPTDYPTGSRTGVAADGGQLVPLNTELRDRAHWLNQPPIARLTSQGTTQTVPAGGVWTSINLTAENVDNYNGHSTSTNNTRYTFTQPGLYFVAGCVSITEGDGGSTNSGYRSVRLLQTFAAGGTQTYQGWTVLPLTGTGTLGTAIWAVGHIRAAAGDYVELQMAQTQSSGTTTRTVKGGTNDASKLLVVWTAR